MANDKFLLPPFTDFILKVLTNWSDLHISHQNIFYDAGLLDTILCTPFHLLFEICVFVSHYNLFMKYSVFKVQVLLTS